MTQATTLVQQTDNDLCARNYKIIVPRVVISNSPPKGPYCSSLSTQIPSLNNQPLCHYHISNSRMSDQRAVVALLPDICNARGMMQSVTVSVVRKLV